MSIYPMQELIEKVELIHNEDIHVNIREEHSGYLI